MKLGIDPGLTGAVCILNDDETQDVFDLPVMPRNSGKGNQIDPYNLSNLIEEITANQTTLVFLEAVHAMPQQGVTGVFSFGMSFGIIQGVLAAQKIPVVMVSPVKWKKKAGLSGKEKDAARTKAIQLYPDLASKLTRKKDVGRADAILIAHYGDQI